jgi:hypothetical protein
LEASLSLGRTVGGAERSPKSARNMALRMPADTGYLRVCAGRFDNWGNENGFYH